MVKDMVDSLEQELTRGIIFVDVGLVETVWLDDQDQPILDDQDQEILINVPA